jgi:hypothetical protein
MIDNNGGGGIPQNVYNNNPNGQFRGPNDINTGAISHHSAVRILAVIENSRGPIHWEVLPINISR